MTPGARVAAAIEILDVILAGAPAERALTGWARRSRFAGSKDRAAVRDHVFDGLRNLRSYACLGGSAVPTGRSVMIGAMRGGALDALFDGIGHAPAPLSEAEQVPVMAQKADRWNVPDWLVPVFETDFGEQAERVALALGQRAPVSLRVNMLRTDRAAAQQSLACEGVSCVENPLAKTALTVEDGARRVAGSEAYRDGLVELQDAASQAVVEALGDLQGVKALDYCAGGGGKSLALAAAGAQVEAHDVNPARMQDIPARAARAGVKIRRRRSDELGQYDLVLVDAPCSGSGAWRRSPDAKWRFNAARLAELVAVQRQVLEAARAQVAPGGRLAYVTCSVFRAENEAQADWLGAVGRRWDLSEWGDGFFFAELAC